MRIKYVSDDEVWVQPSDEHKANVILRVPTNRARLVIGFGFGRNSLSFDADGRDALRRCLQTYDDDGSFAALKETNDGK